MARSICAWLLPQRCLPDALNGIFYVFIEQCGCPFLISPAHRLEYFSVIHSARLVTEGDDHILHRLLKQVTEYLIYSDDQRISGDKTEFLVKSQIKFGDRFDLLFRSTFKSFHIHFEIVEIFVRQVLEQEWNEADLEDFSEFQNFQNGFFIQADNRDKQVHIHVHRDIDDESAIALSGNEKSLGYQ